MSLFPQAPSWFLSLPSPAPDLVGKGPASLQRLDLHGLGLPPFQKPMLGFPEPHRDLLSSLNMFVISEERQGESTSTLAPLLHSWWVLQQVARPHPHTGTGLSFPGDCSPSCQADGCSFLLMEPGRLLVPELGAECARAVGCGVWQAGSHSRCSWLDQEPSSVRRDPGPNSTERTLSANLREYRVSLVFFSTGDTCTTMRVLLSPLSESCSR